MKDRVRYYYSTEDDGVFYTGSGSTRIEWRPGPPPRSERIYSFEEETDGPAFLLEWRADARNVLKRHNSPAPDEFVVWDRPRRAGNRELIAPWQPLPPDIQEAYQIALGGADGDRDAAWKTIEGNPIGKPVSTPVSGTQRDKYILSDSLLGYALRALAKIDAALRHHRKVRNLERNKMRETALLHMDAFGRLALELGKIVSEAQAKHFFTQKQQSEGGKKRRINQISAHYVAGEVDRMTREGKSKSRAFSILAEKHSVSVSTIKRRLSEN